MRPLSRLGIGLTLVSTFLFLALMAELYYLFWHKKRRMSSPAISDTTSSVSSSRELLQLFCFKKPAASGLASSCALNPHIQACQEAEEPDDSDDTVEAQLMRLSCLAGGPPRLLFTIKEETREDLESEDGRSRGGRSRGGSRGRSLGDLMHCSDTPFLTPLSSPPVMNTSPASLDCYKQLGINPLFETAPVSPPPKFQFLKDAEEKLYRRALMEEALRAQRSGSSPSARGSDDEDGSYITIVIGKNRERGHHHLGLAQVIPLPSSPASIKGDSKE